MADKNNIIFKSGPIANVNTTDIIAGQLLFAIENNTGSIYLDKDGTNRIKLNADALKLVNARTINGTSFDGTSDITTTKWGTARNIIISDNSGTYTQTNSGIDGSGNFTLKLPASITATLKGNADTATKATTADSATTAASCTGNAATATKLKTGVAINGTIFDGSAAITTTNWGTARTITISDNAGDYTQANTGINGSANFTLKLPATITAALIGNASSATYATNAGTADTAKACTGNAATASKLKAGVAINGTIFDGSAAITTTKWGTARNISIGNSDGTGAGTAVSVDGSGAVILKLPTEIKANVTSAGKLSGDSSDVGDANTPVYFEDGIPKPITSIDVKSDKAGKLDPGASINGTLFTGESNITTNTWGTARNVTIKDASKTNTGEAVSVNGSGAFSLLLPTTIKATLDGNAATATKLADSLYLESLQEQATIYWNPYTWTINQAWNGANGMYILTDVQNKFHGIFVVKILNGNAKNNITYGSVQWLSSSDLTPPTLTMTTEIGTDNVVYRLYITPPSGYKHYCITKIRDYGFSPVTSSEQVTSMVGNIKSTASSVDVTTATKLSTPRAINGTNFDGSSAITTAKWGTARNISIGSSDGTNVGTAVSVDGSGAVTLKLPTVIKATVSAANKLTVNAGDVNTPVYFENGVPKEVTSIDVKSDKAGKLDPGRNINGTLFTGESDITTTKWGTARNVTIYSSDGTGGGTAVSVDGSGAISLKLPSTIKATLSGNASSATTAAACSGNSATATKLATPRAINGTNFDGSKDITTAHWGTARTIYISPTASTSGTSVNGSSNVSLIVPSTMTGFESITSTKFVVGGKVTLQYDTTNECLNFVFA